VLGIHLRSHPRRRDPWWAIPLPKLPDAFLPYMGQRVRGMALNGARAYATNALHHVYFSSDVVSRRSLTASSWSSIFALAAEVHGRHYGGGVLKIEPSAARLLPVVRNTDLDVDLDRSSPPERTPRARANSLMSSVLGWSGSEMRIIDHAISTLEDRRSRHTAPR
jgi:hypothetical protein